MFEMIEIEHKIYKHTSCVKQNIASTVTPQVKAMASEIAKKSGKRSCRKQKQTLHPHFKRPNNNTAGRLLSTRTGLCYQNVSSISSYLWACFCRKLVLRGLHQLLISKTCSSTLSFTFSIWYSWYYLTLAGSTTGFKGVVHQTVSNEFLYIVCIISLKTNKKITTKQMIQLNLGISWTTANHTHPVWRVLFSKEFDSRLLLGVTTVFMPAP